MYNTVQGQHPQKIVSLVPSITKELVLLGLENQICGITSYCEIPNKEKYTVVASAVDVNIEKVITLQPDVLFASSLNKPETIEILLNNGIRVVYLDLPKSFTEINNQFIEIGKMCGVEERAKDIVSTQMSRIDELREKIKFLKGHKVFFEIGTHPLWCVIPNTFMNDFITISGGVNIASDMSNGMISRESVLLRDPEIIIIAAMGNIGEEESAIWKSYSNLAAAKNNKILIVDADKACSPTPIHFVDTLETIIKYLTAVHE